MINEEKFIRGLQENDNRTIRVVYESFYPYVERLVVFNNGTVHDAKDVLQNALIELMITLKKPDFNFSTSIISYLYGISRNLWLMELRKRKSTNNVYSNFSKLESNRQSPEFMKGLKQKKLKLYIKYFEKLGKECQKLLNYILNELNSKEIKRRMKYKTMDYTNLRKHHCKKKLATMISKDPEFKNIVIFQE